MQRLFLTHSLKSLLPPAVFTKSLYDALVRHVAELRKRWAFHSAGSHGTEWTQMS